MGEPVAEVERSGADHTARLDRARRWLREAGLDALVVLAPDSQYWLCGFESFISGLLTQALMIPAADDAAPVLVVWDADAALARSTSVVTDVRVYRFGVDDPLDQIRSVLHAAVPHARRIAVDAGSRAVPYVLGLALAAALSPARLVDCTSPLADLRAVKSPYELDCMRTAGSFADAGLRAAVESARPGMTERELAASIEHAMRVAGSDYPSIPTELTSGPRRSSSTAPRLTDSSNPATWCTSRSVASSSVTTRSACGRSSSPAGLRTRSPSVCTTSPDAGLQTIRPGLEARQVEAPALAILRDEGVGDGFQMRFGYGTGVGYPPTWLDPLQITRTSTQRLEPGMTFVLHARLLDERHSVGVVVGGTYAVGTSGADPLAGAGPVPLSSA